MSKVHGTLIGLAGEKGSGKSTIASYLVRNYNFVELSYAAPLKEMLAVLGFSKRALYGPSEAREEVHPLLGFSARKAAQTLGTEWGRALNPDLWGLLLEERAQKLLDRGRRVVVSDVRFGNEMQRIRDLGGVVWRVKRHELSGDLHESEAWIGRVHPQQFDSWIHNNKSKRELYRAVRNALSWLDL